jgi:uncharacterized membrane protein YhhN
MTGAQIFKFLIDGLINSILDVGLWAIPLLLIIGFATGQYNADRTSRIPRLFKLSTSFILVLYAGALWLDRSWPAALMIFWGMLCGFTGDLILAEVIRVPNRLVFGIVVFGIGHVFYVSAFVQQAYNLSLSDPFGGTVLWAAFVIIASILWIALIYNPRQSRLLNVGSLIYAWLISIMAGTATSLAIQSHEDPHFILTAIGGLLFLASDLILGNRELRGHKWFLVNDVVWVIYITGQALIVLTSAWIHITM